MNRRPGWAKWSSVQLTAQSRSKGFLAFWLTPVREPSFILQIMPPVLRSNC
nr:MAG TPA: hypothetical protein [Caudoviricetes sp.]